MDTLEFTGGARIGTANATWPFATLKVDNDKLELNASIIGNLVFRPQDIISLSAYSSFLSRGIKINHTVVDYKTEVIFWTFKNPSLIINQISRTGFFTDHKKTIPGTTQEITGRQKSGSSPLKKATVIVYVVLWNVLFLYDITKFFTSTKKGMLLGMGTITALGVFLLSSVLLLTSDDFRKLLLKKDRTVEDVEKFLYFVIFIALFMLVIIFTMSTKTQLDT